MKKNNTAEKAILDAEKIANALKEGTEKNLQSLLNEAIAKVVKESEDDEDEFDVEDVDTEDTPVEDEAPVDDAAESADDDMEGENDADEADADSDDAEDWSDEEEYKVSDNDYDMTNADGESVLKMFNKLNDDDQLFVSKDDEGNYTVNVDEPGEYVIELDADADADADFDTEDEDSEFDFSVEGDDEFSDDEDDFSDDEDDFSDDEDFGSEDDEIELDLDDEDEDTLNEENLGYTDSYQKDVFAKKFNMNEPANKKATYKMDAGAPDGASKPWAGKGNMKPFEKNVDECGAPCNGEDCNLEEDGHGFNTQRAMKHSTKHIHREPGHGHEMHQDGDFQGLTEAYKRLQAENKYLKESMAKMVKAAKAVQAENKQYDAALNKIKESMRNVATLCVNEGRIINLLVNETATQNEKKAIVERYNSVKTLQEGKALYDTIKRELNESKTSTPAVEKQFVAESTNKLNETTFYATKNDPSLRLMERMDNISKFYKK